MCLMCDGWTREEVLARGLELIERHGWMVQHVEAGRACPAFAYTVGLTRFHDHPELLISGASPDDAATMLGGLAAHVREGHRFAAGQVVVSMSPHRYRMIRVNDPGHLAIAQEIYGRGGRSVPGLQLVWSNHEGRWPWDPAWADGRRLQRLYGHTRWSTR